MGGLQAQYAPSMYIGLWSRLDGFERDALTRALEARERDPGDADAQHDPPRLRGGLLAARRSPSARRAARRGCVRRRERSAGGRHGGRRRAAARRARRRRDAAAQGDRRAARQAGRARRRPLGRPRARAAVGHVGAPPRRPLRARRGLDRARRHRPATPPSSTSCAATSAASAPPPPRTSPPSPGCRRATSRRCSSGSSCGASARDGELLDLPRAPLPDPDTPAPVRFLPTWDASLLVHARRTGVLPEEHRPRIFHTKAPQSFPTFLVDGAVAGTWRYEKGAIDSRRSAASTPPTAASSQAEAERLAAFHA